MITQIPDFAQKSDLFDWLRHCEKRLIYEKSNFKTASEGFECSTMAFVPSFAEKSEANPDPNTLTVKTVINTTNLMDQHFDVHIPGIWDKSISENKYIYHLNNHGRDFSSVIAEGDAVKAYTQTFTWKELGFPYEGKTQALVFESTIKREDNPQMFDRYKANKVRQHSVGMRYVKIGMALNSKREDDQKYKEAWDKYYPLIANKEMADAKGFFWYVTEAKFTEGSAVLFGSNHATPTLSGTQTEPGNTTQNEPSKIEVFDYIKNKLTQ